MTANAAANNVLVEDLIVQRSAKGTALEDEPARHVL